MQIIGNRLKIYRKYLGWTQQNIADILGVSVRTYIYWERGNDVPLGKLYNLSEYKLNTHWLLTGEGDMYLKNQEEVLDQEVADFRNEINAEVSAIPNEDHSVNEIIFKIMTYEGVYTDTALSGKLGLKPSAISNWKSSGRVPKKYLRKYQDIITSVAPTSTSGQPVRDYSTIKEDVPAIKRPPQLPAEILTAVGLSEGASVAAALQKIRKRFEQGDTAEKLLSKAVQKIYAIAQAESNDLKELKVRMSQLESGKTTHQEQLDTTTPPDELHIPSMRYVRASAGPGEEIFEEEEAFGILFRRSVLPRWIRPDSLICIRATGNSMEPTLYAGDLIILDRSQIEPISGEIFVIRTIDGLVIKRLKQVGRRWQLESDNPDYPIRRLGKEDNNIGRVAWNGPLR